MNDVLNAVRAMSPRERAKIRALLDTLGSDAGMEAEVEVSGSRLCYFVALL
ncbi:MAG TPA: hypothetical protein VJX67_06545 [Blastocatellia bacterium]|nr:hypothetical protein [Blastocatellia bacterium]